MSEPGRPLNAVAVSLGWRFAEVYDQHSYQLKAKNTDASPPEHLPGIGQMSEGDKAIAFMRHIESDIQVLELDVGNDGLVNKICNTINAQGEGSSSPAIKKLILELYERVRVNTLAGHSPDRATALGLGRMLADTALLPTSKDLKTYDRAFSPYRLQNAYDWLDELSQTLPAQSAQTVRQSLGAWASWIANPSYDSRGRNRIVANDRAEALDTATTRALHRQGDIWRRLLSGEQVPAEMLESEDYVQAGVRMVDRLRRMSGRFLKRWWLPCIALAILMGGAAFAVIWFAAAGSNKTVAIIASTLAALGVTWKGIRATLGKAFEEAQRPLWDAEVVAATAIAATKLPHGTKALTTGIPDPTAGDAFS